MDLTSTRTAAGIAAALALGTCVPTGSASAPPPSRDQVHQSIYNAAASAFGDRLGCVNAVGDDRLILLVAAKKDAKRARSIAKAKGKGLVSVAVVPSGLGEGALLRLQNQVIRSVGTLNPDIVVQVTPPTDAQRSCGTVALTVSDQAPEWVQTAARQAQQTSPDAITLTVVPPGSLPLKGDDIS